MPSSAMIQSRLTVELSTPCMRNASESAASHLSGAALQALSFHLSKDLDHIVEQSGYIDPRSVLAAALLLQALSDPGCFKRLGIEITTKERLVATCPDTVRKLLLAKLQERF